MRAWATPAERDSKGANAKPCTSRGREREDQLANQVAFNGCAVLTGQSLNPDWEELLMGWPVGWTNPDEPCAGIFVGFPMGQGAEQFDYEPPRTKPRGTVTNRTNRVKALGNGVVPQSAELAFAIIISDALQAVSE